MSSRTAQSTLTIPRCCTAVLLILIALAGSGPLHAQTDEIQVYDAQIAGPGTFNLTLHDNFTPDGQRTPAFSGGLVPDHTLNGVPEWAYGVRPWMEAGLYLPLYSYTADGSLLFNGFKLRALFVTPDAGQRPFFYGVNFEFSDNTSHWDASRYTQEIRGIVGWHAGRWDLIVNPIFDNSYKGIGELDFAPSARAAYHLSERWSVAAEEYADFGPIRKFHASDAQSQQLFAVVDFSGKPWSAEAGAGLGLTGASDRLVLKVILSRDLN